MKSIVVATKIFGPPRADAQFGRGTATAGPLLLSLSLQIHPSVGMSTGNSPTSHPLESHSVPLPSRKLQRKNKVISWRNDFAKLKENIPPAARGDAELRGTAWSLPWQWISDRWGGVV